MTASPRRCATDGPWISSPRNAASKPLTLVAGLLIAALGQGECFADVVLTSVSLSGTVTLAADAYRDAQTLTANVGAGLYGVYQGRYERQVSDLGDSGWIFNWTGTDHGEEPYGPGGSAGLSLSLESAYFSSLPGQPVVQDNNGGGVGITLNNVWEIGNRFPGELSFPEALADKSNVRKVAHLDFLFDGATGKSQDLSMLASLVIQSDEPLLRVFVATASGSNLNVITYDSGPLAGLTSSPLVSQGHAFTPYVEAADGIGLGYGVYAITAVPEPSAYAMTLAGVACGGFSMWRRRKRQPLAA